MSWQWKENRPRVRTLEELKDYGLVKELARFEIGPDAVVTFQPTDMPALSRAPEYLVVVRGTYASNTEQFDSIEAANEYHNAKAGQLALRAIGVNDADEEDEDD